MQGAEVRNEAYSVCAPKLRTTLATTQMELFQWHRLVGSQQQAAQKLHMQGAEE
jgi:hypothetical protein